MITLEPGSVGFVAWELSMPRTGWTPSIVPNGDDQTCTSSWTILADWAAAIARPIRNGPIWNHNLRSDDRSIQQPGSRRRLQHRRTLGCAKAASYVLKSAGITGIPAEGYAGTADLYRWLLANPSQNYNTSGIEG